VFIEFRSAFPLRVRPRRDTVSRFGAARFMLTGTYFDTAGFSTFNHGHSGFDSYKNLLDKIKTDCYG
jgi:hypothetical protein